MLHCILLVLAGVISADAPHLVGGKLEVLEGLEIVWESEARRRVFSSARAFQKTVESARV